jgi:hypothetical protein
MNVAGQLPLSNAGANHDASFDLVEQLGRLLLGVEKPFHSDFFLGAQPLHTSDAIAGRPLARRAQTVDDDIGYPVG